MLPMYQTVPDNLTAMQEWAQLTGQILNQAQLLIDTFSRVKRVAAYNGLDELIDSTEPGELVGGGPLTKEQAVVVRAVLGSFGLWLETPIADVPVVGETTTPIAALSRRRA